MLLQRLLGLHVLPGWQTVICLKLTCPVQANKSSQTSPPEISALWQRMAKHGHIFLCKHHQQNLELNELKVCLPSSCQTNFVGIDDQNA